MTVRAELGAILKERSLRLGDFTLSSGRKSSYYLDCRTTTLHHRGAVLIARSILDLIQQHDVRADAIGGLTLGADPIATAVSVMSEVDDRPRLPAFIVRKEAKEHGTARQIEGWRGDPGSRVIVVDDVCTTAGSILTACDVCEREGYRVAATFCVVDREEGGTELLRAKYPFFPLFTARELVDSTQ